MKTDVHRLAARIHALTIVQEVLRLVMVLALLWGAWRLVQHVRSEGGLARALGAFVAEFNEAREGR